MIQGFMLGVVVGMILETVCIVVTTLKQKKGKNNMKQVNEKVITVQDCIDMYEKKDMYTVVDGGKVVGFVKRGEKE